MAAPRLRLSRLWVDISPLREFPAYRRLWVGDLVASAGSQFAAVALPYQVYRQTGSSLQVGLIGLAALGPLLVGALASGVIADAFDRKRLLLASQATSAAGCVLLAFLTASGHTPLAVLYLLAALLAFASSVESPVRNAVIPSLVGLARVPSTAALNQIVDQTSQIAGPAVAGVLLAAFGITVTYVVAAAGFAIAVLVALRLPDAAAGRRLGRAGLVVADGRAALRPSPAGAAGHLPGRPERDGVRDAAGAVPGTGGDHVPRRAGRASACSTRRRRWARCWPRSRAAGCCTYAGRAPR